MNTIEKSIRVKIYDINPKFKQQLNDEELSNFNEWLENGLIHKIFESGYDSPVWYAYSSDYKDDFEVEFKINYQWI